MRRTPSLLIACLLLAAPLAATGCGADDVDPTALAEAADATRQQGGVHVTLDATVKASGETVDFRSEGDADLRATKVHLKTDGDGRMPDMEQVMIGTTMYLHIDGAEEQLGAEWAKIDLAKAGREAGIDFGQLMQMGGGNPADQLDYLRSTADLEDLGEEEVDGVATTRYKGVVDFRRLPDVLPADERARARRSVERIIELTGSATSPVEVWIDEDDLVRRQRFTTKQRKPVAMEMTIDMRFTDFGKRVEIEAPEGDVKDMTDVAGEGLREGG